jgi:hypothetical protein
MKKLVIIPGGFHPFHAGHKALYDAARAAFPSAEIFLAATADTSSRPFPFEAKKKLARIAGVDGHRFIQVKSPFRAEEITQMFDPNETALIFVRSEKDQDQQPRPGGVKKDGSPSYLQPYRRNGLAPMSQHGYMAYLPTVQFGPGMTSATEIRAKWPGMTPEQKIKLVQQLYPDTQQKQPLASVIVQMFDTVMGDATNEAMAGSQASLLGTAAGNAAGGLNPSSAPMPNGADRPRKGVRLGQEFDEATVVNDPDAGVQIRPAGGMGTWDETSLVNNLARKFASMIQMLQAKNYQSLHHVLYKDRVVAEMVRALAEFDVFKTRQGRRRMAAGREVDTTDYVEEKRVQEVQDQQVVTAADAFQQLANTALQRGYSARLAGRTPTGLINAEFSLRVPEGVRQFSIKLDPDAPTQDIMWDETITDTDGSTMSLESGQDHIDAVQQKLAQAKLREEK